MSSQQKYKVTALVSVYNAERFLRGCLENLCAQSLFTQTQVLIVDACSPQNEKDIALEFTAKYPNIFYERTQEREPLYASWNRALYKAQGQYITNANADDRHAPKALEILASTLDAHPNVALVYAHSRITHQENSTFEKAPVAGKMLWPSYDPLRLLFGCCVGPQPMWRRSVHDTVGYFNEKYTIAGDYDMWLRMARHYAFKQVPKVLGLYLSHEHNLEKSNASALHAEESAIYEEALHFFLQDEKESTTSYAASLQIYEEQLTQLLAQQKAGKRVAVDKILFPVYAKALLLIKMQRAEEALALLQPFMEYGKGAQRLVHLREYIKKEPVF